MKKSLVVAVSAASLVVLSAGAAHANIEAYDSPNFNSLLVSSVAEPVIDLPDNCLASVKNQSGNDYSVRNVNGWNTSEEVGYVANGVNIATFGVNNDRADHLDRR